MISKIERKAIEKGIIIKRIPLSKLDSLSKNNVHQGGYL